jgi:hypothetical protein
MGTFSPSLASASTAQRSGLRVRRRAGHQPVLGGEHAGKCPIGDADLGVNVLDVMARRPARNDEPLGDLPVGKPRASSLRTSTSRLVRPAGQPRRRVPRWSAAQHGGNRLAVQPPGPDLRLQLRGRFAGRAGGPVGPCLDSRAVQVGGGQNPPGRGDGIAGLRLDLTTYRRNGSSQSRV